MTCIGSGNTPFRSTPVTRNQKLFLPFFTSSYAICGLGNRTPVCYSVIEKGVPHRKRPDGKLPAGNHRQFRCYCPLARSSPKRKRGGTVRVGEAGIDSVAEFRGCLTVYRSGVHDSKHSCPAPVKRGRAVTILFFLTIRQGRSVPNRSLVFCSTPVVPSPSGISLPSLRMELECY
jgi:hypothetical protein